MVVGANDNEETREVIVVVFCDDDDVAFHFIQNEEGEKKNFVTNHEGKRRKEGDMVQRSKKIYYSISRARRF